MEAIRVEDFRLTDADAPVRMWRASFEHGVGVIDPHSLEEQIEYLRTKVMPIHRVRVAKEAESIVGFLASNPESIAQLYVRVQNIGQGIGTQLLRLAQSESSGSLWAVHLCAECARRSLLRTSRLRRSGAWFRGDVETQ